MEFLVPVVFYRCSLLHRPVIWLGACLFLSSSTAMCVYNVPDFSSVLLYFCQVPFLWSFYAMFFIYGAYPDAMYVAAGLCIVGCINVFHFCFLEPVAAWCIAPYVCSLFGHMFWTVRVALSRHDEDSVLCGGGVAHGVCHCDHRQEVHECAHSGP
jgi:hypothetical protein